MKIVMDFRKYDGVVGGVEQGAIQVTRYMCREGGGVVLVCKQKRLEQVQTLFEGVDNLKIVPVDVETHVMSLANARLDSGFIQDLAVQEGAGLIHFFYNWSFPFKKKVPSILTVHDVIPFTFREAMGFWRNRLVYRPSLKTACRLNDLVCTVSEFSRQDIHRKIGTPLEKIKVVPNGLRDPAPSDTDVLAALKKQYGIENGYILNVGGIHERKNISRLIQSFALLVKEHGYEGRLVITGSVSGQPYQEKMKAICDRDVAASGVGDRIVFTGFISERDLDIMLRNADLLVYPSLYEGFGIPILEAMKVDTPVVTSNATAMPEVAGDAAVLVDPLNASEMAGAMHRVVSDDAFRTQLVERGRKRAEPFSWDAACRVYEKLYRDLARA